MTEGAENIIFLDEVDSTNSYLKSRCEKLPDGTAVTARVQTAGRGRRGHEWASDEGMLPLSVLLKSPLECETLTARAGIAVCEAIEETFGEPLRVMIKWPNDLLLGSFKICGILCESAVFGDGLNVIVGIGVNVSQDAEFFERAGLPHAASLKTLTGREADRGGLIRRIIERVKCRAAVPFSDCSEEYGSRLVNLGREVILLNADGERRAKAVGVSPKGCLICRDGNGTFEVHSGEVSVRGADGYI